MAGLDANKKYKVKDLTPVNENKPCAVDGKVFSGKMLMEEGLAMRNLLKTEYSSLALQLVEVK
jgi:alpha-galactosidase